MFLISHCQKIKKYKKLNEFNEITKKISKNNNNKSLNSLNSLKSDYILFFNFSHSQFFIFSEINEFNMIFRF